jgi:hypothetical protein
MNQISPLCQFLSPVCFFLLLLLPFPRMRKLLRKGLWLRQRVRLVQLVVAAAALTNMSDGLVPIVNGPFQLLHGCQTTEVKLSTGTFAAQLALRSTCITIYFLSELISKYAIKLFTKCDGAKVCPAPWYLKKKNCIISFVKDLSTVPPPASCCAWCIY